MEGIEILYLISFVDKLSNLNKENKSSVGSNTSTFDLVLNSLLKEVGNTYKANTKMCNNTECLINTLNSMSNISTMDIDKVELDTTNTVSKIEPTNKDNSVNIRIKNAVSKASKDYGVDADLIMSVIKVESNFNPNCVSKAGAKGLMQLMPVNVKDYGVKDVFNIEENIDAGTRQLRDYIKMFDGSVEMGLMAYNAGQGTMKRRGVESVADLYKMPKETQNYIPKVMSLYKGV